MTESEIIIAICVLIELWYWFYWFPKAWKNESTQEIKDLKCGIKFLGRYYDRD